MNKSEIVSNIERSLANLHHNSALLWMNSIPDLNEVVDSLLLLNHSAHMKHTPLTGVASSLGMLCHRLCNKPVESSVDAVRSGLFLIEHLEPIMGIRLERIKRGAKGRTYFPFIRDYDAYADLIASLDLTRVSSAVLPSVSVPEDWTGNLNNGIPLIRGSSIQLNPEDQPVVFQALNRLQSHGMLVNLPVLAVYDRMMRVTTRYQGISPVSFHNEPKPKSRKGKKLEALILQKVAHQFKDDVFYSYFNLDFRGRMYSVSSYLSYQASGAAKGMLLSAEAIPLGPTGYQALLVHTANCFGIDKVSLVDRVSWVIDNFADLMLWAKDPVKNRGWFLADSPWEFLACLFELQAINEFEGGPIADYPCRLLIAADGSCNGSQWMAMLAQDESTATMVNLRASTVQDKPEDLYSFVARYAFETVESDAKMVQHRLQEFEELHATAMQWHGLDADKLPQEHFDFYSEHFKTLMELAPLFWIKVTGSSDRRKLVKRNSMTLGYGVTEYGCGDQINEDGHDVVDELLKPYAAYLGTSVYAECKARMPLAMNVLDYFEQQAAKSNALDKPFRFTTPTNFPMVQTYWKTATKQFDFEYLGERIQLRLSTGARAKLNKRKQVSSASPNVIHSLDASHLATAICAVDFPVGAVHDSYLCHPSNAQAYALVIRESFIEIADAVQLDGLDRGTFDRSEVLESVYAFV